MGNKRPKKGGGRQARKTKFKKNDPFYKGAPEPEKEGINKAPVDKDLVDIPKFTGGTAIIGGRFASMAFFPVTEPEKKGAKKNGKKADPGEGLSSRAKRRHRAKERQRQEAKDKAEKERQFRMERSLKDAANRPELPVQEQGETAKSYAARVDKAVREHFQRSQGKVNTDVAKAKRRDMQAKKKERQAQAKAAAAPERPAKREKIEFGDVAERPPELLGNPLKAASRQKRSWTEALIAGKGEKSKAGEAGKPKPLVEAPDKGGQPAAKSEFANYAESVRQAYLEMRKRRRAGPQVVVAS